MIDLDEFRDTYFEECEDLFATLEKQLELMRGEQTRPAAINEVFRAVHSVKGGAGALRMDRIVAFSHRFETLLDLARSGKLPLDDTVIDLAYDAADMMTDIVANEQNPGSLAEGMESRLGNKMDRIIEVITGLSAQNPESKTPASFDNNGNDENSVEENTFFISYDQDPEMLRCGNEPLFLIRELQQIGDLSVETDTSAVPDLASIDPLTSYFRWKFRLYTSVSLEEVEEVFEFVAQGGGVSISKSDEAGVGQETSLNNEASLDVGSKDSSDRSTSGASTKKTSLDPGSTTIRVDLDRVDKLVNLVGQIAISQTLVTQHLDENLAESHPGLIEEIEQLQQYTQSLQDGVMAIRALPVGLIFSRLPKLVRELSRITGKPVKLFTSGEDTEIDKTVVEQLYDPLMHMIRNSVDHGIESPEERQRLGKKSEGRIRLSAWQTGGKIVIQLEDDGAGINREKVLKKAIENGIVSPDSELSDEQIDQLIMAPGFSTADTVSEVSGRGVGMDVVCESIHRLGGQVNIKSEAGKGTAITMTLPLTLAVMDGMAVRVAGERYVIPITTIIQSMPVTDDLLHTIPGEGDVMRFRNHYVRVIRLESVFGIPVGEQPPERLIVLLEAGDAEVAIMVDEIIGQLQVVTKTLEQNFKPVPGIAAATILGDGEVALIIDPSSVAAMRTSKGTIKAAPAIGGPEEREVEKT